MRNRKKTTKKKVTIVVEKRNLFQKLSHFFKSFKLSKEASVIISKLLDFIIILIKLSIIFFHV